MTWVRTGVEYVPSAIGVVAQLVEHHNGIVGVRGSNPLGSTKRSDIHCFPHRSKAALDRNEFGVDVGSARSILICSNAHQKLQV